MLTKYILYAILIIIPITPVRCKQIYKNIDGNGNVSFSDKPLTDTKGIELNNTKFKIRPSNSGDPQQVKGLLFTLVSGADKEYAIKENGIITIYSKKKYTLRRLLHILKSYYEIDEKRIFIFDYANMFSVEINDFKNLTLSGLLSTLEKRNLIKFYITEGKIEVWREANRPYQ